MYVLDLDEIIILTVITFFVFSLYFSVYQPIKKYYQNPKFNPKVKR